MPPARADYRSDIEGLRGAAILLVVLYHAGVSLLAGGFVGVDVFFVLSGFFMTAPLVRALARGEGLDVDAFYARRAGRLLPVLFTVLAATLALTFVFYAPIDRADVASNARAVALQGGNLAFASRSLDYFSTGDNPLLHTWSLGVEQQFYLVWPPLLLLCAWIARRRVRADASAEAGADAPAVVRGVLVGLVVIAALSFAASCYLTYRAQAWAFFGLPTRLWEFALGGALSLVAASPEGLAGTSESRQRWWQTIGLAAILAGAFVYDRATPYPGVAALLPALGTALLLAAGAGAANTAVGRALSVAPLQGLGRLSYAWYLWHWPLILLGVTIAPAIGVAGKLAWAAGALAVAWLTHRYVERPARDAAPRTAVEWRSMMAFAACVGAALLAHGAMRNAERGAASPVQRRFAAARADRMPHDCWVRTVRDRIGPCAFGDTASATTVVLLGDSHAEDWLGAMDRIGRERGWKIVLMVKGGCPYADMRAALTARMAPHYRECVRYREASLQRVIAMRPAAVVLSSWDHYVPDEPVASDWQVTPAMWRDGLRRTYARLTAAGIRTVAIRGTPRPPFDVPACLSRHAAGVPFAGPCTYARDAALLPAAQAAQTEAARRLPVTTISMNDAVCGGPRCAVEQGGTVIFTDDNHLTATFSRQVAPVLGARLAAALPTLPMLPTLPTRATDVVRHTQLTRAR